MPILPTDLNLMKRALFLRTFLLCALLSFALLSPAASAQEQADNYERLSALTSEELMRQGREYFERREAAKALSRFLIVAGRMQANAGLNEALDPEINPEHSGASAGREDMELCVRALNNAGCVYKYFYYDYPQAYEYFNRAYDLCREIGYDSFLPVILVNLGDLLSDYGVTYHSEGVRKEAENIFNDCFEESIKNKDWELLTTSFFNLSNLRYDLDLSKYSAIFSKEIPADTPDIGFVRLQYAGVKNLQEGRYAEARECFERQLAAINTPWEASRDTICAYFNIAETYKRENDFDRQAGYLRLALDKADQADIIDMEADISRQLADCYRQLGDSTLYYRYHALYLEKREEMHNARLANIGELKYISDLRKEEARAREVTIRNRYLRMITLSLGIVLLVIGPSLTVIWRNNRTLKARNRSLFEKYQLLLDSETAPKETKYAGSSLDEARKEQLISRIREVMANPECVCREDFTSKELAQMVDSNTTYVSQVINEKYGLSFSTLLGNSRVKIVCHRISEGPEYDRLTIEGIANCVGFKSRTAFINAFKREVGLTPSQYIKMAAAKRDA